MHRIHILVLLSCLFCLNLLISSFAVTYDFDQHPVAEGDTYTGFIAELDTSNSLAAKFETTLAESIAEGANFAGKYRLTTIDCGEQCQVNVIVDVSNGIVVDSMVSGIGVEYTNDSRLVQINPDSDFEYYLVWNEDKQRFFRGYAQEVVLNDDRSCFWLGTDTNGTTLHLDGSNNIYGCDPLANVEEGTQASILRGTLYHDGGAPLGNFAADYMELKLLGNTAEIAQEKQVNIDIKQIRTQTGSCLKLDPIELEPTLIIYYLCDEGDDTHIVVLSNGFTQIGDALITEMVRLKRDGDDQLLVDERLPLYIGLSAAGVDGVSESEKVSEVKPETTETQVVATEEADTTIAEENTEEVTNAEEASTEEATDEVIEEVATTEETTDEVVEVTDTEEAIVEEADATETEVSTEDATETSTQEGVQEATQETAEETTEEAVVEKTTEEAVVEEPSAEIAETVEAAEVITEVSEETTEVESAEADEIQTIVEEIDAAVAESMEEETIVEATIDEVTADTATTEESSSTDVVMDESQTEVEATVADEITNPQTIGLVDSSAIVPLLYAAPATQETIDSVTNMMNPTSIGIVDTETEESVIDETTSDEATSSEAETLADTSTADEEIAVSETTTEEAVETADETETIVEAVETEVVEATENTSEEAVTETASVEVTEQAEETGASADSNTMEEVVEAVTETVSTEEVVAAVPTVAAADVTTDAVNTDAVNTEAAVAATESTDETTVQEATSSEEATLSATDTVVAEVVEEVEEISAENWQSHPDVISTRMMYRELNEYIDVGLLRQKTQSFENCDNYQESDRKLWSDKGVARRYIASYGGDHSAAEVEHSYDVNGMLRYVYISEGVQYGEDATRLEHRIYYTEEGTLLWHDKQVLEQNSFDLEDSKIIESITFNPELAFNASHVCDQTN